MTTYLFKTILVGAAMMVGTAFAQDGIRLGQPGYAGNGCPPGSAAAILSPDASSLSILFSNFQVEAGQTTGRQIDRKNCTLAVPVSVPQGLSISIISVDYRGYNSVPVGGYSQLDAEYFFAGSRGPSYSRRFDGPIDDDYTFTNDLVASALVWSPCGAQTTLRVNSAIRVSTNRQFDQAMSTVDSADIAANLIYHLQWRRCF